MTPLAALILTSCLTAADPEASVEAGREALDHWWPSDYPWYDPQADGVERVNLRPPYNWPNWQFKWPDLSWLWPQDLATWVFWILVALLVAAVVYLLVRYFRSPMEDESTTAATNDDGRDAERVEALPFPVEPGKLDLLGQARDAYLAGDYARAVVYLFSHQLVQLDKHHIIRLTKGKTNRQYLREVGTSRRRLRDVVNETMVAFEDVFFGGHPLQRPRFESCWAKLDDFQRLTEQDKPGIRISK